MIDAAADQPVNLLNTWREMDKDPVPAPDIAVPSEWKSVSEAVRLSELAYDQGDAVHIRDAMLAHTMATYVAARASGDVAQVQAIFNFVVRTITLRNPDEPELPFGVYEMLLLGRGTAADRAWAMATLLRQLRLDCVILRPAEQFGADPEDWLLGVILNDQVYLFDPRLGTAIPSTTDLSKPAGPPATLAAIIDHPEWLQLLAVRADQPYKIEADMLKSPVIEPIVEGRFWCERMKRLEAVLPADDQCILYDALNLEAGQSGLLTRIGKAFPQTPLQKMKVWGYASQRTEQGKALVDAQNARFAKVDGQPAQKMQLWEHVDQSLNVPVPIVFEQDRESMTLVFRVGQPERKLFHIRTEQLLGKFDDATKRYLTIRHLEIEPPPEKVQSLSPELQAAFAQSVWPTLVTLNRMASENAMFWTGCSKFESGDYEAAIEQLSAYGTRYGRSGRWSYAARSLLAECHAELGRYKQAAELIEQSRSDDPYRAANAFRAKRWKARQ
jgi:hypothetical protein